VPSPHFLVGRIDPACAAPLLDKFGSRRSCHDKGVGIAEDELYSRRKLPIGLRLIICFLIGRKYLHFPRHPRAAWRRTLSRGPRDEYGFESLGDVHEPATRIAQRLDHSTRRMLVSGKNLQPLELSLSVRFSIIASYAADRPASQGRAGSKCRLGEFDILADPALGPNEGCHWPRSPPIHAGASASGPAIAQPACVCLRREIVHAPSLQA